MSELKLCSAEGCSRGVHARGMCRKHYNKIRKNFKGIRSKRNKITETEDYIEIELYNKDGVVSGMSKIDKDKAFIVDICKWSVTKSGYAIGRVDGKPIFLHRFLAGYGENIDHINRDKLDNRISNLRVCTIRENKSNVGPQSNNSTGYKGVSPEHGKYRSKIMINGKNVHLGVYPTAEEAAIAYNNAAKNEYGEFAYLNKVEL